MVAAQTRDRRAERRAATRAEILDAAWQLARVHGLAGLALRDVALAIGLRPPSLYWYFASKHAVYDAMFAQANQQLLAHLAQQPWPTELRPLLRLMARVFVAFGSEDVTRYQLLFQRTIPDFEPSAESYALAVEVWQQMRGRLVAAGLADPAQFDMWTALVSGLMAQQTANDPGGDRWLRLVDPVVDMFVAHVLSQPTTTPTRTKRRPSR